MRAISDDGLCKGCKASVRVTQESLLSILNKILATEDLTMASDKLYSARIANCLSCASLDYGTTCRFCGCLVQVRAHLAEKHCPDPLGSKW